MQVQYYQPVPPHQMLYHLSSPPLPPPPSCLGGPPQCPYYAAPAFFSQFAILPQAPPPPPPPPPPLPSQQQQQQQPQSGAAYYGYPQHPHQQLPPLPPPMPPPPTSPLSGLMLQFQSLTVGGYSPAEGPVYGVCHYGQDYQTKLLTWLKTHRMHKYFDRLRKYSFEQLLAIDRPTLEALEFTQGAIKKLLGMLERVRQDRQAFDCPSRSSGSPCSSGACSEEELQMHSLMRSPPRQMQHQQLQSPQQHQAMLRKQPMMHQQQRILGPLPMQQLPLQPLPPPPPPPHLQHPQQQRQLFKYSSVSRAGEGCGSPA